MASLRPPCDLAELAPLAAPDRLITLPDRYDPSAPAAAPARFEGTQLFLTPLVPRAGAPDFGLRWPGNGAVRTVDLAAADAAALGFAKLVELSLLPFEIADVLRAMPGGVPTFYFGFSAPAYPADDAAARADDPPIRVAAAMFGILFQDRCALAPWGWFDRIAAALRATRPAEAVAWEAWSAAYAPARTLRLLDAIGRPFGGQTVTLDVTDAAGNGLTTITATSDANGALPGLVLPSPGRQGGLSWQPDAATTEPRLPIMALTDQPTDAVPGSGTFPLGSSFAGGHLQLVDLARWFAPGLHADPEGPGLGARYRRRSRMQPLVDGIPSFAAILADLDRAKGQGGAAHFAGWAFTDFPMRPGDDATSLLAVGQAITAAGADVRVLVAQFLQAPDAALDTLSREIGLIFLVLTGIGNPVALITAAKNYTSPIGLAVWAAISVGALVAYATLLDEGDQVGEALRKVTEQTAPEFFERLAALNGARFAALRSPHPVTMADNPVAGSIPLPDGRTLGDLQDRWGVFHQKIQLIRFADGIAPDQSVRHAAYVGGIDVNQNRADTPGHQGAGYSPPDSVADPAPAPFHDVHCRITGPAAAEVFAVFAERYRLDAGAYPPTATPTIAELGAPGRDVIQVAQTSFRPAPGATTGFPWAPQGDATTYHTIIAAIRAAREYIYIEEQYMVADDGYIDALVAAAGHCRRLVILLPSFLEIFFGDRRRGQMFDRLQQAWGRRLLIGTPMRRPVLAPTGRVASKGRMTLVAGIGAADQALFAAPATRVPEAPFFLWIGGELIYATRTTPVTGPDGKPAAHIEVLRGGLGTASRWCPNPRPHVAGEPVTMAEPTAIFVHSKIMMVDDLFVSIGSTNINRRGFFHDGEINAFAIPQDLKGAADNPARDLRTRLWAEQLGLSPDMGASLLADPIAGFELFRRSRYQGNRFVSLDELKVPTPTLADLPALLDAIPTWARQILQVTLQVALEAQSADIFNTLSDPTTGIDPAPRPGPGLP
jgi:phosphatidylserine/phosphatidylglycerophosphate/cardiolipin synthase-like enzyme